MKTPRLPQVGELAYSANGSPIGALTAARATVKRHRPQATIELEIEEGLTLDATSLMTLPDEQKQVGIEKLRELQLQVRHHGHRPVWAQALALTGSLLTAWRPPRPCDARFTGEYSHVAVCVITNHNRGSLGTDSHAVLSEGE